MIGKILTLIIVCAVIYLVFFKMLRKKNNQNKEIENFIECEKCGTFVPLKDTILSSGKHICRDCIRS
ncbi:PP0621 family protein [Campylobacter mucosalis]|uniref:PP0621 family protein n=1 Tax=Campylobacter mucosalis TaxID=202 RepID=UPI00146FDBE1|nr:PP0621 family protein [Campylobacter mucosalis]